MQEEIKVLNGVCKALEGLTDIMESLPATTENVELWQEIGEAAQTAKSIIAGR